MYSKYYGFSQKPFELNPDPNLIFLSETHQEVMAALRYGVLNHIRFLLITGNVGTGKTTLVQGLLHSLDSNIHLCYIPNPNLTVSEFYYYLSAKLGMDGFDGNKAKFILSFGKFLQEYKEKKKQLVLIIDEVQVLSREVLEEIRLISNQELHDTSDALSIILVGQPEFNLLFRNKELFPLQNRIAINITIKPLSYPETNEYIIFRLRKAGCDNPLFTQKAIQEIYRITGGIPRSINILCDNALLAGFAEQRSVIEETTISHCAKELCIGDREAQTSKEEPLETQNIGKSPDTKNNKFGIKNINKFIKQKKISLSFLVLIFLLITLAMTTDYWGRNQVTAPVRVWFGQAVLHNTLLKTFKQKLVTVNREIGLSSAGQTEVTNDAISISKNSLNKTIIENETKKLEKINLIEEVSIDKKKVHLKWDPSLLRSIISENSTTKKTDN
jgi:general secretion pathway protein A